MSVFLRRRQLCTYAYVQRESLKKYIELMYITRSETESNRDRDKGLLKNKSAYSRLMYKVDERSEQRVGINYVNSRCSCDASPSLSLSFFVSNYAERRGENRRRANRR